MTPTDPQWDQIGIEAGRVFTPTAPIDERSLFSGRVEQIRRVIDAVNQKGQHAIIFGERGVGKTSLANVLASFLTHPETTVLTPRVNCDGQDTFAKVWKKIFEQLELSQESEALGFTGTGRTEAYKAASLIEGKATPDAVRRVLTILSRNSIPIFIVDEFDRLNKEARHIFADCIKTLSDHAVGATVVAVGVADSVNQLIEEHQSVERALVQIPMPRMSEHEIHEIITKGLTRLGLEITDDAMRRISLLSQGLPHYTHLLGLNATRAAIDSKTKLIDGPQVDAAIMKSIEDTQQSVRSAWHQAIRSPRKDNLFSDVLLACALAETDELGFFAAQNVREPIQKITGKSYGIPSFAKHMNEFCEEKRGRILCRIGTRRKFRFRFSNPLMQPFVIMQGFAKGKIPAALGKQKGAV